MFLFPCLSRFIKTAGCQDPCPGKWRPARFVDCDLSTLQSFDPSTSSGTAGSRSFLPPPSSCRLVARRGPDMRRSVPRPEQGEPNLSSLSVRPPGGPGVALLCRHFLSLRRRERGVGANPAEGPAGGRTPVLGCVRHPRGCRGDACVAPTQDAQMSDGRMTLCVGAKNLSPFLPRAGSHQYLCETETPPHVCGGATGRSPLRRRVDLRGGG